MKALVTGAAGLLGRALLKEWSCAGEEIIGFDHAALDLTDEQAVTSALETHEPDVVINCAAWTDVDGCEFDPKRAALVNAYGVELLALACRKTGALLITISTDYVFDGKKEGFYTQRDQPNPESVYAKSKLDGEHRAQQSWARTIIVRSGYIFGEGGRNFLSTVTDKVRAGEKLKAIGDVYGTPTFAPDLGKRLLCLARLDLPGIYHVVNQGNGASFADFTRTAISAAGLGNLTIEVVPMDSLSRAAPRPRNSRLRCLLSEKVRLDPLPSWQDAVKRFVGEPHL